MATYLQHPSNDAQANRSFGDQPDGSWHWGTDWGWGQGDTVYAMADGVVSEVRALIDYGRIIVVDHSELIAARTSTRYCHLSRQDVRVGDRVHRGQPIGVMGATGSLTDQRHLHSELWLNGIRVDEQPYQKMEIPTVTNQRTVRPDQRAQVRVDPSTSQPNVGLLPVNSTHTIIGWQHGEDPLINGAPAGNSVWFKLAEKQWAWSGGFTDPSAAGITDINPAPVGATKEEVEQIVKDSEARVLAAINALPKPPTPDDIAGEFADRLDGTNDGK